MALEEDLKEDGGLYALVSERVHFEPQSIGRCHTDACATEANEKSVMS